MANNYNENIEKRMFLENREVFYAVLEGDKIVTFLTDEIHPKEEIDKAIERGCLLVNEELWQYSINSSTIFFKVFPSLYNCK